MALAGKLIVRCGKCCFQYELDLSGLKKIKTVLKVDGRTDDRSRAYNYLVHCPKCRHISRLWKYDKIDTVNGPVTDPEQIK